MATDTALVAAQPESNTPYQLNLAQTTQACKVLLKNINEERQRRDTEGAKVNLLANTGEDDDEEPSDADEVPIWLIMTTKKHIVDQKRLKPGKIALPHSINTSANSTICLISADPASAYRTAIDSPAFPAALRTRITRIIALSKLKTDFKSFESRRKLFAEHDLFLADDRVVTFLPQVLGSTFYKGGSKRPIPVSLGAPRERGEDGKRVKLDPTQQRKGAGVEGGRGAASPDAVAREIERAVGSALVNLAPGTTTSVKVGRTGMAAEHVSANIDAVVAGLVEKYVTKGWRNVRAIHVKGPNTVAFPVWLANELWVEDEDVHEQKKTFGKKAKRPLEAANEQAVQAIAGVEDEPGSAKKRKADVATKSEQVDADRHAKKKRKAEAQEKLAVEIALRKDKLKKQKQQAMAEVTADGA